MLLLKVESALCRSSEAVKAVTRRDETGVGGN